ncbi:MAG: glutamine--fructose-6-phosphate transaminase (isomerizing) [Planctomycetes bacterium]|jgi:glucosamine--fructose-6-phosphate aminotransferase (isomerizing)|nr:glutamine--fructose-6-phosphate transaminase (isomerizing) [Planctomycetota bacterium]
MCGIICYVGDKESGPILIQGLKALEYRGYDSAGLAVLSDNGGPITCVRAVGKVSQLEEKINGRKIYGTCGIAHTRWATHGEPTEANAHPHCDQAEKVFVIHNGIIENYLNLKKKLEKDGVIFKSQTDTEILAQLIAQFFTGDLALAVRLALGCVEGTYGLAVIHRQVRDQIVVARRGSPLILGIGKDEHMAASDTSALVRHTNQVIHLQDNEIAVLTPSDYSIMTIGAKKVQRQAEIIEDSPEDAELNGYPHYMLKEIYEQPDTIENAMRGRLDTAEGDAKLGGLEPVWDRLKNSRHLVFAACGTSYYAACIGKYIFEKLTEAEISVELASEFRYRRLNFPPNTFVVVISQSGETADTLAAIKEARRKGASLLGIVNVVGSSLSRETEAGVYNHAGSEIGVASTKIFTSQLVVLALIALRIGRHQKLSFTDGDEIIKALRKLPDQAKEIFAQVAHIEAIAEKYSCFNNWLYVGRKYSYPVALEGALKLKEVSYIHAEGCAAGEMKHGPIALINPDMPTVAIAPRDEMYEKMFNTIQEIKARKGPVIAIITRGDEKIREIADDVIEIPPTLDFLSPILSVIPCQLLAYYCANFLKREIDQPRNLAKSVTVE